MFWGYSPALDLLREYFAYRRSAGEPCEENDTPQEPPRRPLLASRITEIREISDEEASTLTEGQASHVQEDYTANDSGGRIVGQFTQDGDDGGTPVEPWQQERETGQDGGGAATQLQCDGLLGPEGPLQVPHATHGRRHVHLHGADDVQSACLGDHRVCSDGQVGLPSPSTPHHPGDADCSEEVISPSDKDSSPPCTESMSVNGTSSPSLPAEASSRPDSALNRIAKRKTFLGAPGLFDVTASPSRGDCAGEDGCLHVLVLGGLDARHVLKTLSRLHCHPAAKVRLYVAEAVMEAVARQLVFLLAALEPPERMGLTEKARLLMELHGNSLVRPSTARWLRHSARLLVDLVTDAKLLVRRLPVVDLSHLRHQDRDRLEDILAFYQERPQGFRIGFHWDQRLRKHLKTRYDSRAGAFDWDYFMVMRDLPGGDKVCVHEYRHWRETGVAFTWLEGEQSEPNLTMGAGIFREGRKLLHGGYLGDIITSPYISYAIKLEEEDSAELFRRANDQYVCRSTDATERHLSRILYELQHRAAYSPPRDVDGQRGGVLLSRVTDASRLEPQAPSDEEDATLRQVCKAADMMGYDALPVPRAEVVFLSPKFLRPDGRHAHRGKFNAVFLGRGLAEKQLDGDLARLLAPGALVLVEGTRFLLERQAGRDAYAAMVREHAEGAGLRMLGEFDPAAHDFAKFILSDKC